MSRLFAVLALAAVLCVSTVSGQNVACQGAGFDVSSIANIGDLSWTDATARWQYFVRPCGFVTNSNCTAIVGTQSTLCQYGPTSHTAHNLAVYSYANSTWLAQPDGASVVQSFEDGEYCSTIGASRRADFVYVCDASATTPFLYNVSEASTHPCHYTAIIHTSAACQHSNPPGPFGPPGTEFFSAQCGGGRYDLSPLASGPDLYWDPDVTISTSWAWFLRPCGTVVHPNCTAAGPAMLCQANKANANSPHPASTYDSNSAGNSRWLINADGISMLLQDGQTCSTTYPFPRETTIHFTCNQAATTASLISVKEVEKCYYTAEVQTNLVCPDHLLSISSSGAGLVAASSSSSSTGAADAPGGGGNGGGNGGVVVTASAALAAVLAAIVALLM